MNEWQVFQRGDLYQVGRWYQTTFLRRWKIEWHGWWGSASDSLHVFQAATRGFACIKAKEQNELAAKWAEYGADHWKVISCD